MTARPVLAGALGALLLLPGAALACRCTEPGPAAAYRRADAVALVRVEEVAAPDAEGTVRATATVRQAWKASLAASVRLVTGESCAFLLAAGQEYLLYLAAGQGEYGTYICRGNLGASGAGGRLGWLRRHGRRAD